MANWADYFSQAFANQSELTQKLAFEKWQADKASQNNQLENFATMLGIRKNLAEMGMLTPDTVASQAPIQGVPNMGQTPQVAAGVLPPVTMGGASNIPLIPKGFNMFGVPTGYEPDPAAVKSREEKIGGIAKAETQLSDNKRFLEQFGRSYEELKKFDPEIGKTGYAGWMSRKGASIANYFDELPETKAFMVELDPRANLMARTIEGGRITDKDRETYAKSFASALRHPSATNIRLASNNLLSLKDKGADISNVLTDLYDSKIDLFQGMVKEVLKSSKDLKVQQNPETGEFRVVKK